MRNAYFIYVTCLLALALALTACGPPADAPVAAGAEAADARMLPWDRDESFSSARRDLRCGDGEIDGTSISVEVSTPDDRAHAKVSFDLTITHRTGDGDFGLVRAAARPLDGTGRNIPLNPDNGLISSPTVTTNTVRFIGSVPAAGEEYHVGASLRPRCSPGEETLFSIREMVAVGEVYRRN